MSPTLFGVGEGEKSQRKVNLLTSSPSVDSVSELKERNYIGFSECSSVGSSASSKNIDLRLNLKATELRLGLPGSQSPERNLELDEKPLFPLFSPISVVSRSKRGFSDTMDAISKGQLRSNSKALNVPSPRPGSVQESPRVSKDSKQNHSEAANDSNTTPAPKAQVVGWPPIRSSFRKNSMASKNGNEVEQKPLFVKVSMDGAPYLRKVDLRTYSVYRELSSALEKMFSCFTIGQYGAPGNEKLSETKLKDLLNGSEYVVTYEDKDGDWMLVGDVPWEMFIGTCKRLRIMKSCDAIGLAPKAVEQGCKGQKVRFSGRSKQG